MAYSSGAFKNSLGYLGDSLFNVNMAKLQLAKLLADARAKMGRDAFWDAFNRRRSQAQQEIGWAWEQMPVVPSWVDALAGGLLGGVVQGGLNYWAGTKQRGYLKDYINRMRGLYGGGQPPVLGMGPRTMFGARVTGPLGNNLPVYGWGMGYAPFAPR